MVSFPFAVGIQSIHVLSNPCRFYISLDLGDVNHIGYSYQLLLTLVEEKALLIPVRVVAFDRLTKLTSGSGPGDKRGSPLIGQSK